MAINKLASFCAIFGLWLGACGRLFDCGLSRIDVDKFGETDEKGELGWHDVALFGLGLGSVIWCVQCKACGRAGAFVRVSDQSRIDISAVDTMASNVEHTESVFPS